MSDTLQTIPERIGGEDEITRKALDKVKFDIRVCSPGIIQSFDPDALTCVVQLAIREKLNITGKISSVDVPPLLDVPVQIVGTADYFITFPIVEGTECLVVFGDNCMDAWWQSGGIQEQLEKRRHDLSDAFAIIGPRSQVNLFTDYSTTDVQLRNKSGAAVVGIAPSNVINITTTGNVNIGSGNVIINSRVFMEHKHNGVVPGGGTTEGVV